MLAVLWADLDSVNGRVSFTANASAAVISFDSVPYLGASPRDGLATFQAVLYPDGTIDLNYATVGYHSMQDQHSPSSIGLDDSTWRFGAQLAFGWEDLPEDQTSFRITPSADPHVMTSDGLVRCSKRA